MNLDDDKIPPAALVPIQAIPIRNPSQRANARPVAFFEDRKIVVLRHSLAIAASCATSFSRLPFLAGYAVYSAKTVDPEAVGECSSLLVNNVVFARVGLLPALGISRCSLTMIEGKLWESQRRCANGGALFDCSRPRVALVRGAI